MDRPVCGDVGYGKTEVAMRAAFKAVEKTGRWPYWSHDAALPISITTISPERFAPFPTRAWLISRFQSPKETKAIIKDTAAGLVDVLIGTHRLLQKDGFATRPVIIDEEQWFGVNTRNALPAAHPRSTS